MSVDRVNNRPPLPPPGRPDLDVGLRSIIGRIRNFLEEFGRIVRMSADAVAILPSTVRLYPSEVLRQAGILIIASAPIIWAMQFVVGTMCGTEANYTLKQVGAPLYTGIFTSWCSLREMAPYMWAYILAAKVGCGLVAEIGSMRISEEVDAMEVMGIRSKAYLVGTRLLAAWIAMPFLYVVGLGVMYVSMYLVVVVQYGGVSSGGYLFTFWLFQNPLDMIFSVAKVMAMGTTVVLVGCYYGYTAGGGPVGVGRNTAKSMMVNMVLVHVIGLIGTQVFWGLNPNAPIAN
ncbi:ABC transporter permease [Pseudonocardia sp. H11422]|uniref:ABC transporter permease n=1 Tax=Pseudonocardia sp. H11422 TaxID=2835866 RepID=UPI001BDC8986|nr:ABC transporter permease [Pseudonocardia sp. H11422]